MDGEHVWPDNHDIWDVWNAVAGTQWHTLIAGKTLIYQRLDYTAVWPTIKALGIKRRRRGAVFLAIQEMEAAALAVLNER